MPAATAEALPSGPFPCRTPWGRVQVEGEANESGSSTSKSSPSGESSNRPTSVWPEALPAGALSVTKPILTKYCPGGRLFKAGPRPGKGRHPRVIPRIHQPNKKRILRTLPLVAPIQRHRQYLTSLKLAGA